MQEARVSYVHGGFIATLVLALAYVEHVINDALPPMAAAIKQARVAGLFPDDLLDGAAALDTIGRRVWSRKSHPMTILETGRARRAAGHVRILPPPVRPAAATMVRYRFGDQRLGQVPLTLCR